MTSALLKLYDGPARVEWQWARRGRSSGELRQECQQRGSTLFEPGRVQTGEERLPQGLAGWQLCCSLQRGF